MSNLIELLDAGTISAALRMATPLTLAAMGGLLCMRAGVVNLALEGLMLIGAFFGIVFVDISGGNVWIGMLGAMGAGILVSAVLALFIVNFKSNQIIAGIAINTFGLGITSYLIRGIYNQQGAVRPSSIDKLAPIDIPLIKDIPYFGDIISGHSIVTYIAIIVVVIIMIMINKTVFGLKVCSVGESMDAARTAGVNPKRVQWQVILIAGALCGLGGAYLSTEIVSQFSEAMVQGRGFNAFTAFIFGNANPLATWLATLLFGFADAAGIRLELLGLGLSPSIIKMFPFILALLALMASSYTTKLKLEGRSLKGLSSLFNKGKSTKQKIS